MSGGCDEDRARTVATLVSAFRDDPVERWLYPLERDYDEFFPQFVAAFGGAAFAHDTVWRAGGFAAVAMWFSPGVEPATDEIVRVLETTVDAGRLSDTMLALEQMDAAHPGFPHWYLPWLGVEAGYRDAGLGGTLLSHCLRVVDESVLPAYLETPNPRTIPFYERHGFRVTGSTCTEDCPAITFMLREPRPPAS